MALADHHPTPADMAKTTDSTSPAARPATATDQSSVTNEKTTAAPAPAPADDEDVVNPPDFQGEVLSNDELPSEETIRRIGDYIVLDRHGKTHTFKSLYTGRNVARRVLVIFVRHFFCGVSVAIPPHATTTRHSPFTLLCRTARNTSVPSRRLSMPSPSSASQ